MATTSGTRADGWERASVVTAVLQTIVAVVSLLVAVVSLLVSYLAWRHPTGFEELKQDAKSAIQSISPSRIIASETSESPSAANPSFSCASAALSTERFVCSDPDIAAAEREMAQAYQQALQRVSDKSALKKDQAAFLRRLVSAPQIKEVYIQIYKQRMTALSRMGLPQSKPPADDEAG